MIEVQSILYGCQWRGDGHVMAWPLRIEFGARGEEVPVDEMLDGRGYAVMPVSVLLELVDDMAEPGGELLLVGHPPAGVVSGLLAVGYMVRVQPEP